MEFYNSIRIKYGNDACNTLKIFSRLSISHIKQHNTLVFLMKCRKLGLIPNFIHNSSANINKIFEFSKEGSEKILEQKLTTHVHNFHTKLLNIAISLKHTQTRKQKDFLLKSEEIISTTLTKYESSSFFNSQNITHHKINTETKNKQKYKLDKLKKALIYKMGLKFNDKWFVNKTDVIFPDDIKWLLSLGHKFAMPITKPNLPLFKIIADGEEMIKTLEQGDHEKARANFTQILQNFIRSSAPSSFDKFINQISRDALRFLKNHKDIYIVNADKGNVTVAIYKNEYIEKMRDLMADRSTYRVLRRNPTLTLQNTNNGFAKTLFNENIINEYEKKRIITYTANSPRIYGLPKIHKENMPLRPICASTSVPCYELSKFMVKILRKLMEQSKFNVNNAKHFIEVVSPLTVEDDEILVSFDVVSLFTNVPVHMILEIVEKKWNDIRQHTQIRKSLFMDILRFCIIDNNYVQFETNIYQQKQGVPMGSPISPIIADIAMEALLEDVIGKLTTKPKIITKYVDDLFAIIKSDNIEIILGALNSFHRRIQFTVELEKKGELPYLDVKVVRHNGKLIFDWFKKPTSSGRLINFHSKQPKQVIFNTAQNFINRVLDYSNIIFRQKNLNIIRDTLCSNSFPAHVISRLISNYRNKNSAIHENDPPPLVVYRSALYIPSLSTRMKAANIRNKEMTRIAFRSANTLKNLLFTNTKGKIDKLDKSDVVYRINCLGGKGTGCSSLYVGTSKQKLRNRLSGHRSDINNGGSQKTALALHCIEEEHTPDLDNVRILEIERHHNKRMLLEMLHINNTESAINRRSDCDSLSIIYNQLINKK